MSRWAPTLCGTTVCYPASLGSAFSLERALDGIGSSGLRGVEIVSVSGYCEHFMPETMEEEEVAAVQMSLAERGLNPTAVNVVADLSTNAGIDRLIEGLRIAGSLGAKILVTHVEQIRTPEHERTFLARVDEMSAAAERYGVRVGFETHGGLCATGEHAVAFAKRLGSHWLGVTYDTANVIYYAGVKPEEDLESISEELSEHIFHVHLKDKMNLKKHDYDFPPYGQGVVRLGTILRMFENSNYQGALSVEVELDGSPASPEIVDEALTDSMKYLKEILA